MGRPGEQVERDRDRARDSLGLLERDRFWHELAEDDREVRQQGEREDVANPDRERRIEEIRDQRLADGTDEDREHRDAELCARDEPHWLVHHVERGARASSAALRSLLQAGATGSHERVLGRDEDRAAENEQQDDDDTQEDAHAFRRYIDRSRLRPDRGAGTRRYLV